MAYFERQACFVLRADNGDIISNYDAISPQENNLTFVNIRSKGWGVVKNGTETISPQFYDICSFKNGFAIFTTFDNHEGAIDKNGNISIQPNFKKIYGFNENGISIVAFDDGSFNLINTTGKTLFSTNFYSIEELNNGYFEIGNEHHLYALANSNSEIITPFKYKKIYGSTNNLFPANTNTGIVIIDSNGKEITAEHDYIYLILNGYIVAYDNSNVLTIMDKTGSSLFVKKYDEKPDLDGILKLSYFFEDYPSATVSNDGKVYILLEHFNL